MTYVASAVYYLIHLKLSYEFMFYGLSLSLGMNPCVELMTQMIIFWDSCLLCKMMGLQVIPMAGFLVGIGIIDEDLEIGEVLEHHGVGAVAEALIVMMVYLRVVVGVLDLTTAGHEIQKAVGMIG